MKALTKIMMIVFVLSTTVGFAQTQKLNQYLKVADQTYLQSLKSENSGVRNSVIFNVVQYKKQYPGKDFKPLVKEIQKISKTDPMVQNRLHAHLALICLEQPEVMAEIDPNTFEDPIVFFDALYEQISEPSFALK